MQENGVGYKINHETSDLLLKDPNNRCQLQFLVAL